MQNDAAPGGVLGAPRTAGFLFGLLGQLCGDGGKEISALGAAEIRLALGEDEHPALRLPVSSGRRSDKVPPTHTPAPLLLALAPVHRPATKI